MKKTKIVCTLGPASDTKEKISAMYDAGMNVCRLNFSHGTHEEHLKKINAIKELRNERKIPLPIMLDTKGPEFRTGRYKNGKITLNAGDKFVFTTDDILGDETRVSVTYRHIAEVMKKGDKILLVQEKNGRWSLPGGWVDVNISVKENVIKEVKEEAGLDVTADMVIAVQDREKHNLPVYAYKVCKIFVLCSVIGGEFEENSETVQSDYFGIDELPQLSLEKNNEEQIKMCFDAYYSDNWKTYLD